MNDKRNWLAQSPLGADRGGESDKMRLGLILRLWRLDSMCGWDSSVWWHYFKSLPTLRIWRKAVNPGKVTRVCFVKGQDSPTVGMDIGREDPTTLPTWAQSRIALPSSLEVRSGCDLLWRLTCELTSGRSHILLFLWHSKHQRSSSGSCVSLSLSELCGAEALADLWSCIPLRNKSLWF